MGMLEELGRKKNEWKRIMNQTSRGRCQTMSVRESAEP